MKKIIALVLTLAAVFAFAGCSLLKGGILGGEKSRSKTYQLYQDYFVDGSYYMELCDTSNNVPVAIAMDGDKVYMKTAAEGYDLVIVSNGENAYMLMPSFMMYYDLGSQDIESYTEGTDFSDGMPTEELEETMETGDMDYEGKSYFYEEFPTGSNSSIRYLFDGDTLVYTIIYEGETPATIQEFTLLEGDVDSALFEIPDGYTLVEN